MNLAAVYPSRVRRQPAQGCTTSWATHVTRAPGSDAALTIRRSVSWGLGLWWAALLGLLVPWASASATLVRLNTSLGPVDIRLLDAEAPATVANFLNYVNTGAYDANLIHRNVPGFVVQAGGYRWTGSAVSKIAQNPPVVNEFSPTRSNVCGTVAMAKVAGNPDSATSEWFVNMANNAANLDGQNGGFTVFGRVTAPGMAVMAQIAGLPVLACSSPFGNLPVLTRPASCSVANGTHFVLIQNARVLPEPATDADRVMTHLEAAYPQFLGAASSTTGELAGYSYRYYATSNAYLAVKDGQLFYLGPAAGPAPVTLGAVSEWLAVADAQGYGPIAPTPACPR